MWSTKKFDCSGSVRSPNKTGQGHITTNMLFLTHNLYSGAKHIPLSSQRPFHLIALLAPISFQQTNKKKHVNDRAHRSFPSKILHSELCCVKTADCEIVHHSLHKQSSTFVSLILYRQSPIFSLLDMDM